MYIDNHIYRGDIRGSVAPGRIFLEGAANFSRRCKIIPSMLLVGENWFTSIKKKEPGMDIKIMSRQQNLKYGTVCKDL